MCQNKFKIKSCRWLSLSGRVPLIGWCMLQTFCLNLIWHDIAAASLSIALTTYRLGQSSESLVVLNARLLTALSLRFDLLFTDTHTTTFLVHSLTSARLKRYTKLQSPKERTLRTWPVTFYEGPSHNESSCEFWSLLETCDLASFSCTVGKARKSCIPGPEAHSKTWIHWGD